MSTAGPGAAMPRARRFVVVGVLLLGVDFLDEAASGIPFVASPDIQRDFGLSYAMAAGGLLAAVQLLSVLLEPPLFLLADRWPRRRLVCGGLVALGVACIAAGLSPAYWVLLVAVALYGPLSGCGVGLSQATLMDANPDRRERMMARWVLMGSLGDLATPVLLSLLALFLGGWRHAFVVAGLAWIVWALALWRQRWPEPSVSAEEARAPMLESLRTALATPGLLLWCSGVFLCTLLDEILVAFAALHLRDGLGATLHQRDLAIGAWTVGSILGIVAVERLLARVPPIRLLVALGVVTTAAYAGWLAASTIPAACVALFLVGLGAAGLYPIAKAQAYGRLPDRSAAVNAVMSLFIAAEVALPLILGVVADRFGLRVTLALLVAQPVGLLLLGLAWMRRPAR